MGMSYSLRAGPVVRRGGAGRPRSVHLTGMATSGSREKSEGNRLRWRGGCQRLGMLREGRGDPPSPLGRKELWLTTRKRGESTIVINH